MRKNFTQKLLTIFAFLSVFAGSTAYAQTFEGDALPPQCTGENPGRIAFFNGCTTELQACPGTSVGTIAGQTPGAPGVRFACAPITNGTVTSGGGTFSAAGTDSGFTTIGGGGTFITYQWFYRSSGTSNFIRVPVSFANGTSAVNGNVANADSTGTGVNYAPSITLTSAPGSLDFVRVRYSGTANVPQGCASVSNIITAFDDRTKPVLSFNGGQAAADTTLASSGTACTVTIPLLAGFNFGATGSPRNPDGGINATDNFCTTTPATTKFTIRYFRNVTFGSTPPNTATSPNQPTSVSGPSFNGTEISSPTTFNVGTTTRITVLVADSSGNYDTLGYNVTVTDTTRPVYTGPTQLTRFTETTTCSANLTGTELTATFSDCQTVTNISYRIFDSTGATPPPPSTRVSGTNAGAGQIGDRTFQRGTFFIVFEGTDPSGNQSGNGGPSGSGGRTSFDTLKLRVVDNVKPIVVRPTNDTFNINNGCRLNLVGGTVVTAPNTSTTATSAFTVTYPDPATNTANCGQTHTNTTNLCANPVSSDNCGVTPNSGTISSTGQTPQNGERAYGPNDYRFELGSVNTNTTDGIPDHDNSFLNIGRNIIKYVAFDASGNISDTVSQEVFVRNVSKPNVFCQADENRFTSNDSRVTAQGCAYRIDGLTGTYNDDCGVKYVRVSFTRVGTTSPYFDTTMFIADANAASGTFTVNGPFRIGQTIVKTVAYDTTGLAATSTGTSAFNFGANRSDTCSFIVTLNDNTAPTMGTCPAFTLTLGANGTGTLTPANVGSGNVTDCSTSFGGQALTFSLSQSSFTCTDIGTRTVTLTATDASGNSSTCQATVTVRSNISVVVSNAVSSFCSNSGAFTVTPSGGTGPNYSYDVFAQNPAGTDPANPNNGTSGTFTNLAPGTYSVRVTDATTGCTLDTNIVVGSAGKSTTDVSIVATLGSGSSTTLSTTNLTSRVDVRVQEIGGFNAPNVSFFVFKSELPSGVTLQMTSGSILNNDDWAMTENASEYTFTKRATSVGGTSLLCGSTSTVGVTVTRTAGAQAGPFGITFALNAIVGESNQFTYNNSFTTRLTVRNP